MGRKAAFAGLIALAMLAAAVWLLRADPARQTRATTALAENAEGRALYAQYCASCHGANLEGQPDWQSPGPDGLFPAPPHDESGHSWHHGDGLLTDYIRLGGRAALARQGVEFDSGMPGFGDQLNDQQIAAILAFIKSTWSERIRAVQAERTKLEQAGN